MLKLGWHYSNNSIVRRNMNSIFVSSTFRDMQLERDAMRDICAPIINEIAKEYGEKVSFCDLRWGINTEDLDNEISERKVLSVCLDEIDRCSPPMVVILGDRYGYMPSSNLISDIAKRKELQLDDYKKSVTALEIEYGALLTEPKTSNTLFYFREIDGIIPEGFTDVDDEHFRKLTELKEKIIALTGGRLKTYKISFSNGEIVGVKEFAENVANDIIEFLEPEWKRKSKLTPIEKEYDIHWNYARDKSSLFRARSLLSQHYFDAILNGQQLLVIKGNTGCGKSTLVSNLAVKLKKMGKNVIPVFCGLTPRSSSSASILKDIVWLLETDAVENGVIDEHLHTKLKREDSIEFEDIELSDWQQQLNLCCNLLYNKGKEYYFIIDAIDQLTDNEALVNLIPYDIPEGFHFVFSCVSEYKTEDVEVEELDLLDEDEKKDVIKGILESHHRELSNAVISAIASKSNSCNPLYVNLLIERLFLMNANDYDIISSTGDGVNAITNHQLTIINNCPNNLNALCYDILIEGGNRINAKLVPEVLKYIAVTKYGITRDALKGILKDKWSELDFACFVSYMNDFFVLREDGRYDFSHKNIRMAILSFTDKLAERHNDVFGYSLTTDDCTLDDEIMYHAVNSDQVEYVVRNASRISASLLEEYIFNAINPAFAMDFTMCAISNDNKKAIYFVVENLLNRYIRENGYDSAKQIIMLCNPFFSEANGAINCLECLRFAIEEMYFYILYADKANALKLADTLDKLISDATNVCVKENEIEKENALQKESLEKDKKRLEEQHKQDKNKWLIIPKGVLDIRGSLYSEERAIKQFKNELIKTAAVLLETIKTHTDSADYETDVSAFNLNFPSFIDFGLYKGWLLDSGESKQSFMFKMHSLAAQSRNSKEILFIDINNE